MDSLTEKSYIQATTEQKVRDAFNDYLNTTQRGIVSVLEWQRKNWQELRKGPQNMLSQVRVERGQAYSINAPSADIPKRELTSQEVEAYKKLLALLKPYDLSITYGISFKGLPNTRFYLSLRDSVETASFMTDLTKGLIGLYQAGTIPFFQYKFDSSDDHGNLRFDPVYRDKGDSPILYVADKDIDLINQLLDDLAGRYPSVFLPQAAPFKFSPHNRENDLWHISMEESKNIGNNGTPERGGEKTVSQFLTTLGLTKQWTPVQSLDVLELRKSWEQASLSVHRQPKQPWITTERPTPNFFVKNK